MTPAATNHTLHPVATSDGDLYVDHQTTTHGSQGPFYAAYREPDGTHRYGWFCSSCESIDTAMDSMGTIVCNMCGNRRKPTHWDAAYL